MQSSQVSAPRILPLIPVSTPAEHAVDWARKIEVGPAGRVIIDIVGICQAKCPYCAQNSGKARRQEKPEAYMPVEMFRQLVGQLARSEAYANGRFDRVYLYNWGEPFLAPAINDYLQILKEHRLLAAISSNFQKVPVIRPENLAVISQVIFSVSGLTDDTYSRIHGGPVAKVLANFEAFLAELKRYSPKAEVNMSWHRYRFNEHQFWDAYSYCRRHGIGFIPAVAFIADHVELIQAASDRMPPERKHDAQRDLFYDEMLGALAQYEEGGDDYNCPAWDDVVINESGRMLICCGADSQSAVGSAFDLSFDEMKEKKMRSGLCKACRGKGVAEWSHSRVHDRNQIPWPSGGGISQLRLKMSYGKLKVRSDIRDAVNNAPFGEVLLKAYRKFKELRAQQ